MIDLTTYALLRKQIATAASGISDVRVEGDELVFVLVDGHEVRMAIPATEIRDAVVRDDVLVLTLEDGKEVVVDTTLTQSGQAADAKVTGDAVSQLKDDITDLHLGNLDIFKAAEIKTSIIGSIKKIVTNSNKWVYAYDEHHLSRGDYILVISDVSLSSVGFIEASTKVFNGYDVARGVKNAVTIPFYMENEGSFFIRLQASTEDSIDGAYSVRYAIYGAEGQIFPDVLVGNDVLKKNKLNKISGKNLFDKSNITQHFYLNVQTGEPTSTHPEYDYFFISDYISVAGGESYVLSGGIGEESTAIVQYSKSKEIVAIATTFSVINDTGGVIVMEDNTAFVRFSNQTKPQYLNTIQFEKGTAGSSYEEYTEYKPCLDNKEEIKKIKSRIAATNLPVLTASANSMTNGSVLDIPIGHNSKHNNEISFIARVSTFGEFFVGRGNNNPWCQTTVIIGSQNITVNKYTTSEVQVQTFEHGLTIADFVSVSIKALDNETADIILSTSSGVYNQNIWWNGCDGNVRAGIDSGDATASFTDCVLSYHCMDEEKHLWAFGDSYFDFWPIIAKSWGYTNWMADGRSGRGSADALEAFKAHLANGRIPRYVLWCMGMNDTESGAMNTTWKSCVDEMLSICDEKGITPILTTVPNTTIRDNSYKNAYVIASGRRYVDINKAVGGDLSLSWYNGMQSADNVHPSEELGAKIIAARFVADVPELRKIN